MNQQSIRSKRAAALLIAAGATVAAMAPCAHGVSATWTGTTDNSWATVTNWVNSVPVAGDVAIFNNAGNGHTTLDLGAGVAVNTILFDTINAAGYTVGSGAVGSQALTLDNNAASITINATVLNDQRMNANITLGTAATGVTSFTNASQVAVDTYAGNITGGTGGTAGVKSIGFFGAGTHLVSGNITPGGATSLVLTKGGAGMLILSGNNNFGSVNLSAGFSDIVRLTSNGALGTAPIALTSTTTTMELANGITTPNAITFTAGRGGTVILRNFSGNNTYSGALNMNVNSGQAALESYSGLLSVSGVIGGNGTGTTRQFIFQGAGDGILTSTSTMTGTVFNQLRKDGPGVLTLAGIGTLSGSGGLPINGGTLKFDDTTGNYHTGGATTLAFAQAGGTVNVVASAAGSTQSFGSVTFTGGESVLQSTYGTSGVASVGFLALGARTNGATLNFLPSGGTASTPGSAGNNFFSFTNAPTTLVDPGVFFNGSNYAIYDAGGFVRGLAYGTDAGATTVAGGTSISGTHVQITAPVTAQQTTTLTTLNIAGNNDVTFQDSNQVLTVNGILKTGNTPGGASISGGLGMTSGGTSDMVIRTDGPNDTLTINVPIGPGGGNVLTKSGKGTLNLTAGNGYTGTTFVHGGTLNVSGTINAANAINTGAMLIDNGGVVNVTGTVNVGAAATGNAGVAVGLQGPAALNVNGGNINFNTSNQRDVQMGVNAGGYGVLNLNSGNITDQGFLVAGIGGNGAIGIVNIQGGNYNANGNFGGTVGTSGNAYGVLNITSGSYNSTDGTNAGASGIYIGEGGNGVMNISGTGVANLGGAANSVGLNIGRNNTSQASGIVNLGAVGAGGGTISTVRVQKTGAQATGVFNFHGGMLQARGPVANPFMGGLTAAYVYAEGGTIDTNGNDITISQPLLNPTGVGVTSVTGLSGSGFTGSPLVMFTGGSGFGATAVANVDSSGNLTGITMTNPGVYSSPPTGVTLIGGGRATITGSAAIGTLANSGGGITKIGGGSLTLTGANNYRGNTTVLNGTLLLPNQVLSSTGSVSVVNGATLSLSNTTINTSGALNVTAATLSLKDNLINTATFGSLKFDNSTLNFELNSLTADKITTNGAATLPNGNLINLSLLTGQGLAAGSYTLIHAAGGGLGNNFNVGTAPNGFFNFTLANSTSTDEILTVTGNPTPSTAYWSGAAAVAGQGTSWGAGPNIGTSNWATNLAGTIDAKQVPGGSSDVIFTANNATGPSLNTNLDATYAINSLTINVPASTGITSTTIDTSGNSLILGAGGLTMAATSNSSGTLSGGGTVTVNGAQNWNNNSNTQSLNVSAQVSSLAGATTLTIGGTGTGGVNLTNNISNGTGTTALIVSNPNVTLTSNNSYTGTTTVAAGGVLNINGGRISSETTVNSGGTLALIGGSDVFNDANTITLAGGAVDIRDNPGTDKTETIGGLSGTGTVTRSSTGVTTLTVGSSNNLSTTFAGVIQDGAGTLALTKGGTGTFTLSGTQTYTGQTTAFSGILQYGTGVAGGDAGIPGNVVTTAGGTVAFNNTGSYAVNTTISGGGAIAVGTGGGTATLTGNLTGFSGILTTLNGGTNSTLIVPVATGAASILIADTNLLGNGQGIIRLTNSNAIASGAQLEIQTSQAGGTGRLEVGNNVNLNFNTFIMHPRNNLTSTVLAVDGNDTINASLFRINTGGSTVTFSANAGATLTLIGTMRPAQSGEGDVPGSSRVVTFNGAGDGTFAGNITNRPDAAGTISIIVTKGGTGTWRMTGNNDYVGNPVVPATGNASNTAFPTNVANIIQNGTLDLVGSGAQTPVLSNSNASAYTDIQGGRLAFEGGAGATPAAINSLLSSSFHATGSFNNTTEKIRSTTSTGTLGLGMTYDGASKTTIGFTVYGDANLDGTTNALDFNALATNFGAVSGAFWYQGDFNYDGQINTLDFNALAANFNAAAPTPTAGAPLGAALLGTLVPEPASMGAILMAGGLTMLRRRRRAMK